MFHATPQTPLREYLEKFFLAAKNHKPTTQLQYRVQVGNLERFWIHQAAERNVPPPPLTLDDLRDELIYAAMNWQVSRDREATTANKIRRHVNAIWNFAEAAGILSRRPKNKKFRENVSAPLALLPEQLDKLLETAGMREGTIGGVPAGQWWVTQILFIYSLGTRITATYEVRTEKLDLNRGEVLVVAENQKQGQDQLLDLLPGVVYWLRQLQLKERGIERVMGDWPHTIGALRKSYTKLFVEAGFYKHVDDVPRNLKFHALRKTLASQLFAAGGMPAACERMGHSSTQVTERYIDPRYKRKQRIGELVKDPSPAALPRQTISLYRPEAAG